MKKELTATGVVGALYLVWLGGWPIVVVFVVALIVPTWDVLHHRFGAGGSVVWQLNADKTLVNIHAPKINKGEEVLPSPAASGGQGRAAA